MTIGDGFGDPPARTPTAKRWKDVVCRQLAGEVRYEELGRRPLGAWGKGGRSIPWGSSTQTAGGEQAEPEWAYHFRLVEVATGEVAWEGWDHPEAAGPHYQESTPPGKLVS